MDDQKTKLNFASINVSICIAEAGFSKSIIATPIPQNPKVKMAQIGGPAIIGERISSEPIIDRFGDVVYIEGRKLKNTSFMGEIELSEIEKQNLKNFNDDL